MSQEANIEIIVTDMGNGGAFCGICWHGLDGGDPSIHLPAVCPKCGAKFVQKSAPYVNVGGSDF